MTFRNDIVNGNGKGTMQMGRHFKRLAFFMLPLALCGCGKGGGEEAQEDKSLTMCISELEYETLEAGFEEYKEKYPDVDLRIETYSVSEGLVATMERLNTEIMAGEGPDLILMEVWGNGDVYKMMDAGAFAPLDDFMDADSEWDKGKYVESALDAGAFHGKQMLMPLKYSPAMSVASQEGMERAGVPWEDTVDILTYARQAADLYEEGDAERVFAEGGQLRPFAEMLTGNFLDYGKKAMAVGERELRQACEAYKRIYPEESGESMAGEDGYYGYGGLIASGDVCFYQAADMRSFIGVSQAVAAKATPAFFSVTDIQGETLAKIAQYVGINAASKNQRNAWNMIKTLMGEAAQGQIADNGLYCPVLKSVIGRAVDQVVSEEQAYGSREVDMGVLTQEYVDAYKNAIMNPQRCYFVTDVCVNRFMGDMEPYFEGEEDYDACLGKFRDYIMIYLSE